MTVFESLLCWLHECAANDATLPIALSVEPVAAQIPKFEDCRKRLRRVARPFFKQLAKSKKIGVRQQETLWPAGHLPSGRKGRKAGILAMPRDVSIEYLAQVIDRSRE